MDNRCIKIDAKLHCNCKWNKYNFENTQFLNTKGWITELSRPGFSIKT